MPESGEKLPTIFIDFRLACYGLFIDFLKFHGAHTHLHTNSPAHSSGPFQHLAANIRSFPSVPFRSPPFPTSFTYQTQSKGLMLQNTSPLSALTFLGVCVFSEEKKRVITVNQNKAKKKLQILHQTVLIEFQNSCTTTTTTRTLSAKVRKTRK